MRITITDDDGVVLDTIEGVTLDDLKAEKGLLSFVSVGDGS